MAHAYAQFKPTCEQAANPKGAHATNSAGPVVKLITEVLVLDG
jgi:hypothetical protein